ncbi:MAG: metallophosphoesterase [Desulfobacteraceae bacterium]|jgi:predicted phosphodiesterase
MTKRVIFSDLHFGDPACSLRRKLVTTSLRRFLTELGTIDEIIFAGDILDANIASLTRAIEGRKGSGQWPEQIGFRYWLSYLLEAKKPVVGRIVYILGNHDYIIWNILSTDEAFVQPVSKGKVPENLPVKEAFFPKPFISGVAPPKMRDHFVVEYPDYVFDLAGRTVLVTHGHYLDEKQTLFKKLEALIQQQNGNEARAIRNFFKYTAQYQVLANAVSFMKDSREFVDKVHKKLSDFVDLFDIIGKIRNKPIDGKMLEAIEMYLHYFRKKKPDVFIFGHTHEAAHTTTAAIKRGKKRLIKKVIDVWNDGSFIEGKNRAGTFIVVDDKQESEIQIKIHLVTKKGDIQEMRI